MNEYKCVPLGENVEEMFIGPFGSSLKNECFVDEDEAYCMVYEQKHAIQKTMDVETRYVNEQKYNELKRFNIHGGDIIVSCRGTIGETFVVPEDAPLGIMHPSIMKIRLKDGIYDKYYFNLLLKSRLKKHEAEANGSGIKMAISATELGRELFPVPTMQEQQEITDIISGINDVIEKRKQELSALDDLIKARFVEMFGDPIANSKGWDIVELGELTYIGSSKRIFEKEYVSEGIPFYRTKEIVELSKGNSVSTELFITEERFAEIKEKYGAPKAGDLLISAVGTIGVIWIVDGKNDFYFKDGNLIRVDGSEKFNSVYMKNLLEYLIDRYKKQMSTGTAYAALTISGLTKMKVYDIPMELQNKFADFVHQVDKSKVAVQKALDETKLLFDSLMQQYFG